MAAIRAMPIKGNAISLLNIFTPRIFMRSPSPAGGPALPLFAREAGGNVGRDGGRDELVDPAAIARDFFYQP